MWYNVHFCEKELGEETVSSHCESYFVDVGEELALYNVSLPPGRTCKNLRRGAPAYIHISPGR